MTDLFVPTADVPAIYEHRHLSTRVSSTIHNIDRLLGVTYMARVSCQQLKFHMTFERTFVVGLSMRRPGFYAGRVDVRFVVNKLVLDCVFPSNISFFLVISIPNGRSG